MILFWIGVLTILCYGRWFTRIIWFQQLNFCITCEMCMQTILNPHYFTHMIIMVMVIIIAFEYEIKLESNLISSLQTLLMVALLVLCVSPPLTPLVVSYKLKYIVTSLNKNLHFLLVVVFFYYYESTFYEFIIYPFDVVLMVEKNIP